MTSHVSASNTSAIRSGEILMSSGSTLDEEVKIFNENNLAYLQRLTNIERRLADLEKSAGQPAFSTREVDVTDAAYLEAEAMDVPVDDPELRGFRAGILHALHTLGLKTR